VTSPLVNMQTVELDAPPLYSEVTPKIGTNEVSVIILLWEEKTLNYLIFNNAFMNPSQRRRLCPHHRAAAAGPLTGRSYTGSAL